MLTATTQISVKKLNKTNISQLSMTPRGISHRHGQHVEGGVKRLRSWSAVNKWPVCLATNGRTMSHPLSERPWEKRAERVWEDWCSTSRTLQNACIPESTELQCLQNQHSSLEGDRVYDIPPINEDLWIVGGSGERRVHFPLSLAPVGQLDSTVLPYTQKKMESTKWCQRFIK